MNYVAYNTSDAIMSGDGIHLLVGIDTHVGYFVAACGAAALSLLGYRWIHFINRLVAWPLVIVMALLSAGALAGIGWPSRGLAFGPFEAGTFMSVFTIVAGFQLGWAPYVSDYSRYLPAAVGVRDTFVWTYLPSGLSAIWVFVIGSLASSVAPGATPVAAFKLAGDRFMQGFGSVAIAALLLGQLAVMAVNQYGGMMALISIRDSFKPVVPTLRVRVTGIAVMFVLVWTIAQYVGVERFNLFYANVLIFLAYLFTPWTAINLVDYFLVRRGRYSVLEIFKPGGIYGRWGWRGNTAYLVSLLAMVPFMVTDVYKGRAANALGGVDCSMFVGLALAAALYWLFCRSLDLRDEMAIVSTEGLLWPASESHSAIR